VQLQVARPFPRPSETLFDKERGPLDPPVLSPVPVPGQEPEAGGNLRGVEELTRHRHLISLDYSWSVQCKQLQPTR